MYPRVNAAKGWDPITSLFAWQKPDQTYPSKPRCWVMLLHTQCLSMAMQVPVLFVTNKPLGHAPYAMLKN